jgi:hypothetical protein
MGSPGCSDEDLAIKNKAPAEGFEGAHQLGKIAGQRTLITASQIDLPLAGKHETSETIPLRFVDEPVARQISR